LEVREESIITFPKGLLGFEGYSRFTLIESEEEAPFSHLQNIEHAEISFVVTDPFIFFPDYDWVLSTDVQKELGIQDVSTVMVRSIVIVPTNPLQSTVNLMAPLVINRATQQGVQFVIHDSSYGIRVPLLANESQQPQGGQADAGAVPQE
jgi:flagellar assembly factor FliW